MIRMSRKQLRVSINIHINCETFDPQDNVDGRTPARLGLNIQILRNL